MQNARMKPPSMDDVVSMFQAGFGSEIKINIYIFNDCSVQTGRAFAFVRHKQ